MKSEIKPLLWLQAVMLIAGIAGTVWLSEYARSQERSFDQEEEKSFSYYHEQIKVNASPEQPREKLLHLADELNFKLAEGNAEASALWHRLNRLFVQLGACFVMLCAINIVAIVRALKRIGKQETKDDDATAGRPPGVAESP
jgi:hypothetical protein